MSIYSEVYDAEQKYNACINWETGEISDELEYAEKELQEVLNNGIETLCKILSNKQSSIESLKSEIERLTEKKKLEEKRLERLEEYISSLFEKTGKTKIEAGTFTLSFRKSVKVIVDADFNNEEYFRVKKEIDKAKIKTDLLAGVQIKDAHLVENKNLQIK